MNKNQTLENEFSLSQLNETFSKSQKAPSRISSYRNLFFGFACKTN